MSNSAWVMREAGAGVEPSPGSARARSLEIVGRRVDGDPDEEGRRRVDRLAREVLAAVEVSEQGDQPDRVDVVHAARTRIVAHVGRVTGHSEDVPHPLGMRAEKLGLEPHD